MTQSSRPLAIFSLALLAAAIPWLMGSRDPIEDARDRLAAMTPAQRKAIEENREKYDRLNSFEQYELRELANALAALPSNERAELVATMGKLAAWVATFPDAVRTEYEKALPSGRRDILKGQLVELKKRENAITADVAKALAAAEKAEANAGYPEKTKKDYQEKLEQAILRRGSTEDKDLFARAQESPRFNPPDKMIVMACLGTKTGLKPQLKGMPGRRDPIPISILRACTFIPTFSRALTNTRNGLSDVQRKELAAVVLQIYSLQPPRTSRSLEESLSRLGVSEDTRPFVQPAYLLEQLAALKDYSEKKTQPNIRDLARVKKLLEP